jgi:hypothetical protein
MLSSKMRKRSGHETRVCVSMKGKAFCLLCSEGIVVLKECNIARLHNSKHKDDYKEVCLCSEEKKVCCFKKGARHRAEYVQKTIQ